MKYILIVIFFISIAVQACKDITDFPECDECFKISMKCKAAALNIDPPDLEEMQKATVKCDDKKALCLKDRKCRNR